MAKISNICIGLINEHLADLDPPQALEDGEAVHQIRVLTKRLRAAWHLAQPICGKELAKQRRAALRDLSALLAKSRDQAVQLALAEKFQRQHPEISRQALEALFPHSQSPVAPPSGPGIRQALEAEIAAWAKVRLGSEERRTLRRSWRASLKRAKSLTVETSASSDPELWHRWRKAVKRLRYQREFLAMVHPRVLGKRDLRIRNLGTRLGDHNDLAIFSRRLDSANLNPSDRQALKKMVALQDRDIKRNCRRLGRRLFCR